MITLSTISAAQSSDLTAYPYVTISRFSTSTPIFPADYVKVGSEPTHIFKFHDSAGNWFEIGEFTEISPFHAGANGGPDDTVATQAALDLAQARGSTFNGSGATWSVSKLNISLGNEFFTIKGPFLFKAISGAAQTCLLEITRGNFGIVGTLAANVQYKSNYAAAIWIHNDVQIQYITARDIIAVGALIGLRIGDELHGASVTSEITVSQFRTFGCPVPVQAEGYNAYVTFDSPPSMSGDVFGGDATWALNDLHGIVTKGFGQLVIGHGGEVTQTASGAATDYLIDMRPMAAGGKLYWGRITINGAVVETGGPLLKIHNPDGLTGTAPADRPVVLFDNCSGYHSQDNAPFIEASADYDGDIRWKSNNVWKDGATRTHPNIKCNGNLTHVWVDDSGFGNGFQPPLAGVVGGILHFSRRLVNFAYGLPAVATVAGANVLKFTTAVTTGDLPRWSGNYNPSTGQITVPAGGYEEITIRVGVYFPGVTGGILIRDGTTEVARCPFVNGVGQVEETFTDVPAGTVYTVVLDVASGSGGVPSASGFQHRLKVWASR